MRATPRPTRHDGAPSSGSHPRGPPIAPRGRSRRGPPPPRPAPAPALRPPPPPPPREAAPAPDARHYAARKRPRCPAANSGSLVAASTVALGFNKLFITESHARVRAVRVGHHRERGA